MLSPSNALRHLAAAAVCVAAALGLAPGTFADPASPAPVLAREDSMRQYDLPEPIRVNATRVPLLDIIRKAQEGERRKYEGLATVAYTQMVKVSIAFEKPKPKTECHEVVQRVYYRAPNDLREVTLREDEYVVLPDGTREEPEEKKKGAFDLDVGVDDDEDAAERRRNRETADGLTRLPDYLERLDRYEFRILNRSVRPGQIVYEIGFEPKSDFDLLPSGRMWILTGRYQVVREEIQFRRVPMPGIIKGIDLVTREWQEIDGRWLQKRITGRARMGLPGFMRAPTSIEIAITFDQYAFNPELDPKLFGDGAR